MSTFASVNPTTGAKIKTYQTESNAQIEAKISLAHQTFTTWKDTSFKERTSLLIKVADHLTSERISLASAMTEEMGKRTAEALAEIDKCALVCRYYADNAETLLASETVKTEAKNSYISFAPLGVVFAVMPWNFPFWQVFRAAAPAIMAGNAMLLKHASSVPSCALLIEQIFAQAGAPAGLFQTLLISGRDTKQVIEDPRVRLISLTGSEEAGSQVAALAGQNIKKVILELGGSDPFIVMPDADLELAAATAATARMIVSGQSCIAAKRFIVHHDVVDKFTDLLKSNFESKKIGDPKDPTTDVGPLSSQSTLDTIHDQVERSLQLGATLVTGGKKLNIPGFFYPPTIISNVSPNMPVGSEETFGPVAAIISVSSAQEALEIANDSHFGLGSSVWTQDPPMIEFFTKNLQAGCVFVNSMVKSDPRLPFGGTKFSGFGRELGSYGIKEFVNIKTIWIN